MINMNFKTAIKHEVNVGETSFFDLKKGESVHYKVVPQNG